MVKNLAKLSVLALLLSNAGNAGAGSFSLSVRATACEDMAAGQSRSEIRYKAYDKAAFLAIKSSSYLKLAGQGLDDHSYDVLAYRLADKALNDVTIITTRDDSEKVCLELSGTLDEQKAGEILQNGVPAQFNPQNVAKIAKEVNASLPKSIYETDSSIPLLYVQDMEFYNQKTSSSYTMEITQQLSFEPRVLVTEDAGLADYILVPKLLLSKIEPIDAENSRYSMSVAVELHKKDGVLIDSARQNRYIIVEQNQNMQEIARKLLGKLLKDALKALSGRLNSLLKE